MNFDSMFCTAFIFLAMVSIFQSDKDVSIGMLLTITACAAAIAQLTSENAQPFNDLHNLILNKTDSFHVASANRSDWGRLLQDILMWFVPRFQL